MRSGVKTLDSYFTLRKDAEATGEIVDRKSDRKSVV